jgi:hypothetical protein
MVVNDEDELLFTNNNHIGTSKLNRISSTETPTQLTYPPLTLKVLPSSSSYHAAKFVMVAA